MGYSLKQASMPRAHSTQGPSAGLTSVKTPLRKRIVSELLPTPPLPTTQTVSGRLDKEGLSLPTPPPSCCIARHPRQLARPATLHSPGLQAPVQPLLLHERRWTTATHGSYEYSYLVYYCFPRARIGISIVFEGHSTRHTYTLS